MTVSISLYDIDVIIFSLSYSAPHLKDVTTEIELGQQNM